MAATVKDPERDQRPRKPKAKSRWGMDGSLLVLLGPALLLVALLFVWPFLYGIGVSLTPAPGREGIFSSYTTFFGDARERASIWNTLRLAVPATLINLLLAVPLAYRMRNPLKGQRLITVLFVVPMTLGVVLIARGMLTFLGPGGWFNKTLMTLGVIGEPLQLLNNYTGVLISLIIAEFPVMFLLLLGYASGIDPNLERAGRMLGAGAWQRFTRIMLPLMMPGIAIAAALGFMVTFAVFPSAVLVGEPAGSTRVIALAAWQAAYERFDYSMGSAIAIVMAAIELLVVAVILFARSRLYTGPASGGKG
jgi:putative spermidine/putrescine transport system permease protein